VPEASSLDGGIDHGRARLFRRNFVQIQVVTTMYSFIRWISCWFSSLFTYIFGTIQRLLSVQGKTCIRQVFTAKGALVRSIASKKAPAMLLLTSSTGFEM